MQAGLAPGCSSNRATKKGDNSGCLFGFFYPASSASSLLGDSFSSRIKSDHWGWGFANMIRDLRALPSVHSVPSLLSNPQRGFCGGGGVGQSNIDQKHFHLQWGEKDNMADGLRGQNRWAVQGHRALSGESTRRTQHQARAETTEAPHMPPLLKPWRGTQWVRVFVNSYPHTHATRYAYPGPVSITVGEPTPAVSVPKRMYQNPLPTAPVLRPQTLGVP